MIEMTKERHRFTSQPQTTMCEYLYRYLQALKLLFSRKLYLFVCHDMEGKCAGHFTKLKPTSNCLELFSDIRVQLCRLVCL